MIRCLVAEEDRDVVGVDRRIRLVRDMIRLDLVMDLSGEWVAGRRTRLVGLGMMISSEW
jgi:hypothetical protein